MANERNLTSTIISAVIGCTFATIVLLIFFNYFGKQPQAVDGQPTPVPVATATPANQEIPNPEIKAADFKSVKLMTVYKGFFDASNKCSRSYNEYFGNDDGVASPSSPCEIRMEFSRDGRATRTVEVRRWDKAAKEKRLVEKADSSADVTPEQFDALAKAIAANEAFVSWRDGTMINVSNSTITVTHTGGTKSVMSNVDEKTTVFLQMFDAIRQLEKQLIWRPVQ